MKSMIKMLVASVLITLGLTAASLAALNGVNVEGVANPNQVQKFKIDIGTTSTTVDATPAANASQEDRDRYPGAAWLIDTSQGFQPGQSGTITPIYPDGSQGVSVPFSVGLNGIINGSPFGLGSGKGPGPSTGVGQGARNGGVGDRNDLKLTFTGEAVYRSFEPGQFGVGLTENINLQGRFVSSYEDGDDVWGPGFRVGLAVTKPNKIGFIASYEYHRDTFDRAGSVNTSSSNMNGINFYSEIFDGIGQSSGISFGSGTGIDSFIQGNIRYDRVEAGLSFPLTFHFQENPNVQLKGGINFVYSNYDRRWNAGTQSPTFGNLITESQDVQIRETAFGGGASLTLKYQPPIIDNLGTAISVGGNILRVRHNHQAFQFINCALCPPLLQNVNLSVLDNDTRIGWEFMASGGLVYRVNHWASLSLIARYRLLGETTSFVRDVNIFNTNNPARFERGHSDDLSIMAGYRLSFGGIPDPF